MFYLKSILLFFSAFFSVSRHSDIDYLSEAENKISFQLADLVSSCLGQDDKDWCVTLDQQQTSHGFPVEKQQRNEITSL